MIATRQPEPGIMSDKDPAHRTLSFTPSSSRGPGSPRPTSARARTASSPELPSLDTAHSEHENTAIDAATLTLLHVSDSTATSTTMSSLDSLSAVTDPVLGAVARAQSTMSFPEMVDMSRDIASKSHNPKEQLHYAMYLFDAARKVLEEPGELLIPLPENEDADLRQQRLIKMKVVMEAEGFKWLKKLATRPAGPRRQPLPEAQFILAEMHGTGQHGLPVDYARAFDLYSSASKQNHPAATFRAAVCYELGAGTKRDFVRAAQFYRKAAALGDYEAMHKLALVLLYGQLNQRRSLKEGVTWLKRAVAHADAEHPESLHDLAQCYERIGGCPILLADEAYALELYTHAAEYGLAQSQYRLGLVYEYGQLGAPADPSRSILWYSKAAEQGHPDAELALSHWYLVGSAGVLEPSDADALRWTQKAADRGHVAAEYTMGHYAEVGIGMAVDLHEAKRWYERAAAAGSKKAAARLAEIKRQEMLQRRGSGRCVIT